MSSHFAKSSGWICRRTVCRLNTRRYLVLSLAWCFASFRAIDLLTGGSGSVPWAGLVCWILVFLHAAMIALTVWSALTEAPRTIIRRFPDPNYHLREWY